MLNHGTGRLLALCLAVAVVPVMPSQVDAAAHSTVVTRHTYVAGDTQGGRILDWIATHSPDRPPLARHGAVVVESKQYVPGSPVSISAPDSVPQKGHPGDAYSVKSAFADGTTQTWDYRWVVPPAGEGGGWGLVGYAYRKESAPVKIP